MTRRERYSLAPGAVVLAVALATVPALIGQVQQVLLVAGGFAVVLYLAAVLGLWPGLLPWSLGLLALEYVGSLYSRAVPLDLAAPLYGAALFCCAELGWLSLERRQGQGMWPARALGAIAVGLGGTAVGWLALLAPVLPLSGGLHLTALGVVAAVAILATAAWVAAGLITARR